VKLSVSSSAKKLAGLSLLRPGDCFGEGCLVAGELRTHTATSLDHSRIRRIGKASLTQRLRKELPFAWLFVTHLLLRIRQAEESRADHLLNSSEKRLARLLLQLGGYKPTLHQGRQPRPERLDVSQAVLADIVGTTRSRVSYFMNRFREKGLIAYDIGGIQVRSGLLNFVLRG
jgi:CRP/FNR family transcriptional regulator, cyclic AMP receptor protein